MQLTSAHEAQTIDLTQEEAFALLTLCMLSHHEGDKDAESALRKLANYCKQLLSNYPDSSSTF